MRERERQTETDRQADRQTDRQREREREERGPCTHTREITRLRMLVKAIA